MRRNGKSVKKKKYLGCLGIIGIILIFSFTITMINSYAHRNDEPSIAKETKSYNETNSSVKEADTDESSFCGAIAQKHIRKLFGLANAKVDVLNEDFNVLQIPDDKNSKTGEVYKNVFSGAGKFEFQDRLYPFQIIYSRKSEKEYSILYLYSPFDRSNYISAPLESDK